MHHTSECDAFGLKILACDEPHFSQTVLQKFAASAEKLAKLPPRPPVNGLSGLVAAFLRLRDLGV
jgi:hypothetical protein